jgi:N-methylhydantoinase A
VNLRVSGIGPITRPRIARRPYQADEPSPLATRDVFYERWGRTVIYRRGDLGAGAVVRGPAVIEEYGSTLPVHPGFTATMDDYGNLVVVSDR